MTVSARMRLELADALGGRLMAWRGLWEKETVEGMLDILQPVMRIHPPILGERENKSFQVVVVERSTPPVHVELWYLNDQAHVILFEYDDPLIDDLEATLQTFGAPEWILEDKRFLPAALVTEHVYASRGITISIATPDAGANLGARRAVHVQLYSPESVGDYLTSIGADAVLVPEGRNPLRDLQNAFAGRLTDWRGLIGTETIKTVSEALQSLKQARPAVESERMTKRFRRSVFDCNTPPVQVEAWVLCSQEHLTLVEYNDPVVQNLEESLQVLGTPELVLENKRTAEGASVKELVYASRGITLSVAEPYPWANITSRQAVHVQLYRASSVHYYWRYIGPGPQLRPIQVKGGSS